MLSLFLLHTLLQGLKFVVQLYFQVVLFLWRGETTRQTTLSKLNKPLSYYLTRNTQQFSKIQHGGSTCIQAHKLLLGLFMYTFSRLLLLSWACLRSASTFERLSFKLLLSSCSPAILAENRMVKANSHDHAVYDIKLVFSLQNHFSHSNV